eukprot:TRINITY_DN1888_c0_g1_i3.p1 TRINITY_DN1888_c0_g1~~TRINITY_DN1888_c0_g1_i3.p1  ORF type:complete len:200 (+),score=30.16 TRINITY_DN1888_c0_g1_i3:196-795(+)
MESVRLCDEDPLLRGIDRDQNRANQTDDEDSLYAARSNFFNRFNGAWKENYELKKGDGEKFLISQCSKGEKEYYEKQFATLRSFEEVDSLHGSNGIDEAEALVGQALVEQAEHELAMRISNYANIMLLAFKIYATIKSGSISIAASTLDSLLDLMAGGILWFTHLSMKNINIYKYPIGKLRVQPVGIIIFAAIMATLGM